MSATSNIDVAITFDSNRPWPIAMARRRSVGLSVGRFVVNIFLKPISSLSFRPNLLKFCIDIPWSSPDKSTKPLFAIFAQGPVMGKNGQINPFS